MKRYFQLLALLIVSIPAGFLTIVTQKPYPSPHEYTMILILGTLVCVIVLGGLSWLVYFTLRRQKNQSARKRAFQVYGFLAVVMIAVGSSKFPEAKKARDRMDFMADFDAILGQLVTEKIRNEANHLSPSVAGHHDEITVCTSIGLSGKKDLVDQLIASSDPEKLASENKELNRMIQHCIDLYR